MIRKYTALFCALGILAGTGSALAASPGLSHVTPTTEAPAKLSPVAAAVKGQKAATPASELESYGAREKASGDLAKFKGGHAGYVAIPISTIVIVTVLLIILL